MPLILTITLVILGLMSLGLLVYWSVVLFHVARTMRTVPTLRAGLSIELGVTPTVCVVVPAHNEERGIGELLESLKKQDYAGLRFVFALDRCTDRTLEILRAGIGGDERFEIVEIDACPEEWVGKVHALWRGVNESKGTKSADLLLFLDADTKLEAPCIRSAVALMMTRQLKMASVLSTLTSDEWFEWTVQPAAGMELLRQYPIVRANSAKSRRAFANGQFILVERSAYESIKGHEAVKSEVLEDVWLARRITEKGHAAGLFLADGLLTCRMYTSYAGFKKGWLRIFGECANRKPKRLREAAARVRVVGTILPVGALGAVATGAIVEAVFGHWLAVTDIVMGSLALMMFFGVTGYSYWFGRVGVLRTPAFIVGSWMVGSVMNEAARNLERGTGTHWGGKTYQRDVRS